MYERIIIGQAATNYIVKVNRKNLTELSRADVKTVELCGLSQTFAYVKDSSVNATMNNMLLFLKHDAYPLAETILNNLKKIFARMSSISYITFNSSKMENMNDFNSTLKNRSFSLKTNSNSSDENKEAFNLTTGNAFIVSVHWRKGDFLHQSQVDYGLTTADMTYFERASNYFIRKFKTVLFLIISDDMENVIKGFKANERLQHNSSVKYMFFHDSIAQDFAILCRSNGLIISTGTFGWWAAWFNSKAQTIYYKDYPRVGSSLDKNLNRSAYYPEHWIPM
ncbi:hypothetical protein HELRODRAFT_158795 [Helobdella robusta]|uniref:L-Fucosyltransferase n=1 Tax=Helobdella robusta TaxID=6412 RepID=T1EN99_HELRO|nr:hypothetical protein HELRODRAFT_158795 [Helobdella robusta]ESO12308.1 hypothetical protein HELRODRAFT_158795 [Helobdella robusta]